MWMDIAQEGDPEPRSDEEDTVYDRTNPFRKTNNNNPFERESEVRVMLEEQDSRCGIFNWRPLYLQRFGSKTVFSLIFTVVGIFHGSFWTYYTATISTFEKRFHIDSTTSGVLLFSNELAQVLVAILFTYFGFRRHRAKMITLGVALSSLSCFMLASPYYFLGNGDMTSILLQKKSQGLIHAHAERSISEKPLLSESTTAFTGLSITTLQRIEKLNTPVAGESRPPTTNFERSPTTAFPLPENSSTVGNSKILPTTSSEKPTSTESPKPSSTSVIQTEGASSDDFIPIPYLNDEMRSIWPMCSRHAEEIEVENKTINICSKKESERNIAFSLTFIGNFFGGLGSMLFLMSGGPFTEESTIFPNELPRIFGITMAVRLIGTFLGYLFAWSCLSEYISPMNEVIQVDSRWLGAFWLGWTVLGIFMAIFAFVFSMFPRQSPREFLKKRSLTHETGLSMLLVSSIVPFFGGSEQKAANLFPSLINIPNAVQGLFRNTNYLLLTMSTMLHIFVGVGYLTFLPKYLEYMFRVKAAQASILTGMSSVPCQVAGLMLGGAFISRYLPNPREISYWNIIVTALQILGLIVMAFMGCSTSHIDLSFLRHESSLIQDQLHNNVSISPTLSPLLGNQEHHLCSADCGCKSGPILPVCDLYTGTSYYSPCHAGCEKIQNRTKFLECSCLEENVTLTEGFCPTDDCSNGLITFLVFICLTQFLNGTRVVGKMLLSYKSLQADQRAAIIGFTLLITSIISTIPSPIIFGSLFESACAVREDMCSEVQGTCWLYHDSSLRFAYNLSAAAFLLLAFAFDAFLWKSRSLHDLRIYDGELRQLTQTQTHPEQSSSRNFSNVTLT